MSSTEVLQQPGIEDIHESPVQQGDTDLTYRRTDGTIERASSAEDAFRRCPYLGRLAMEAPDQADLLLELATLDLEDLDLDDVKDEQQDTEPRDPQPSIYDTGRPMPAAKPETTQKEHAAAVPAAAAVASANELLHHIRSERISAEEQHTNIAAGLTMAEKFADPTSTARQPEPEPQIPGKSAMPDASPPHVSQYVESISAEARRMAVAPEQTAPKPVAAAEAASGADTPPGGSSNSRGQEPVQAATTQPAANLFIERISADDSRQWTATGNLPADLEQITAIAEPPATEEISDAAPPAVTTPGEYTEAVQLPMEPDGFQLAGTAEAISATGLPPYTQESELVDLPQTDAQESELDTPAWIYMDGESDAAVSEEVAETYHGLAVLTEELNAVSGRMEMTADPKDSLYQFEMQEAEDTEAIQVEPADTMEDFAEQRASIEIPSSPPLPAALKDIVTDKIITEVQQTLSREPDGIDAQPLEQTFIQLARSLYGMESDIEIAHMQAQLEDVAQALPLCRTLDEQGQDTVHMTPEMTSRALLLLRTLGYKQPKETLRDFVRLHGIDNLLEFMEYLVQLSRAEYRKEFLSAAISIGPYGSDDTHDRQRFGRILLGLLSRTGFQAA